MVEKMYFVNQKTGREFEVLDLDSETGMITLRGEEGSPEGFQEPYSKERFKSLGYKLVKREVEEDADADDEAEADEDED